jgi:hypothetical protein
MERGRVNICIYCDMTPESRNGPLLDNGSLKRVSAVTATLVEIRDVHY